MLISQTYRGSAELDEEGYTLLQKWYMLTNEKKHEIIKTAVADNLNQGISGTNIKNELKAAINAAVNDSQIKKLSY
jgi:hypothetical protein